jgi:hypothetical protein
MPDRNPTVIIYCLGWCPLPKGSLFLTCFYSYSSYCPLLQYLQVRKGRLDVPCSEIIGHITVYYFCSCSCSCLRLFLTLLCSFSCSSSSSCSCFLLSAPELLSTSASDPYLAPVLSSALVTFPASVPSLPLFCPLPCSFPNSCSASAPVPSAAPVP